MSDSLESLLLAQELTFSYIQNALTKFKALKSDACTKAQLETRLSTLEAHWKGFKNIHDKLVRARLTEETKKHAYFTGDVYATCEEVYINTKSLMVTCLEAIQSSPLESSMLNQSSNTSSHLHCRKSPYRSSQEIIMIGSHFMICSHQ